jgi:hypothetical protein
MASTRQLRISFLFALVMLVAQFLLGMAVNLFVKIPTDHPGSNPPEYFSNYHQDFSSMIMATGFAIAVVAYSAGLYIAAGDARTEQATASS